MEEGGFATARWTEDDDVFFGENLNIGLSKGTRFIGFTFVIGNAQVVDGEDRIARIHVGMTRIEMY
jgi:hypothetical protein